MLPETTALFEWCCIKKKVCAVWNIFHTAHTSFMTLKTKYSNRMAQQRRNFTTHFPYLRHWRGCFDLIKGTETQEMLCLEEAASLVTAEELQMSKRRSGLGLPAVMLRVFWKSPNMKRGRVKSMALFLSHPAVDSPSNTQLCLFAMN